MCAPQVEGIRAAEFEKAAHKLGDGVTKKQLRAVEELSKVGARSSASVSSVACRADRPYLAMCICNDLRALEGTPLSWLNGDGSSKPATNPCKARMPCTCPTCHSGRSGQVSQL